MQVHINIAAAADNACHLCQTQHVSMTLHQAHLSVCLSVVSAAVHASSTDVLCLS